MRNLLNNMKQRRWGAWNCAVYALLAVVGFVTLNVAGCGGGGGTGTGAGRVSVTLTFRNTAGTPVEASGTVTNGGTAVNFTTTNGTAVVSIPPGDVTVSGTSNGSSFSEEVTVGTDSGQNIQINPQQPGSGNATLVTGRIFLNRGDPATGRCVNPGADTALTARVLIRARNRNTGLILASFVREQQSADTPDDQKGVFSVLLPPGAYTIEVRQAPPRSSTDASAPFTGNSGIFNVPGTQNVTICVNEGTSAPGGTPAPTPTVIPGTTATPRPTATPSPTPGGPGPLPSFTPAPTFTPTPIGGTGSPTPTNTGGPPPPPFLQHGKSVKKSATR